MWNMYDELIESVPEDLTVREYLIGLHWTVICTEQGMGLAKTVRGGTMGEELKNITGMPLRELAAYIKSWNMLNASLGLAAINATLNTAAKVMDITVPDGDESAEASENDFNAFTNYVFESTDKNVAIVGHFPKIEGLRKICNLSILDRNPQAGDFPDTACEYMLPEQDLVFITGTAFINKTMPRLLELCQNTKVILLGPSVPISPVLFKHGVDVIAGMVIKDRNLVWQAVMQGGNKNIYENGGQRVCISR